MENRQVLRCSIWDPTGNITALVEGDIKPGRRAALAAEIMRDHPEVEQLGFLRFPEGERWQAELSMAGGEFCGNASMCAAAQVLHNRGAQGEETVFLRVSGASLPVEVRLTRKTGACFYAGVRMCSALEIAERSFSFAERSGSLPLVKMEGISHLIIRPDSVFYPLREDPVCAERAVRQFCWELNADCLGLMFLEGDGPCQSLTPLVFVPGSGTVFWESSCASGTAAVGMALAAQKSCSVDLTLREPGGNLRVDCDGKSGETWLYGQAHLVEQFFRTL